MKHIVLLLSAVVTASCASRSGSWEASDARLVTLTGRTNADVNAVRICITDALRRTGFTIVENDDDQLRVRAVRPRKDILGIPTSDDFDRIDAQLQANTIQLALTTHDGNERENVSAEARRDGQTVLNSCSAG